MTTITKERLLTIRQWRETYGPGSNVVLPAEEAEELARIALASLEAVSDERAAYELFMEKRFGESVDRRRAKNGDSEYMAWDMALGWIIWCHRAAMLQGGQPVSQTYKLNELAGNYPVTPDGWISCSERMPVIGELNWRTSFPLLVTCEIGVMPAYYGFVSVNGDRHYGFMESLKYGDDSGNHPQTNEYGLISNVTHWMPLPEPPL